MVDEYDIKVDAAWRICGFRNFGESPPASFAVQVEARTADCWQSDEEYPRRLMLNGVSVDSETVCDELIRALQVAREMVWGRT